MDNKNSPDLSRIRNIGIAAHVDAGKTTLTERMLFYAGVSYKIGEVHDGQAHMDYLAEEQAHGITITSALTRVPWHDHAIQLVDTPGHVDFTIEVERAMRVLDGCVIVLDGVRGVEPQTETVWRQSSRFNLPALFFVNKMDRPGADYAQALASLRKRLHAEPVPVTVPVPDRPAVVHLIEGTLIGFSGARGERLETRPCEAELWETMRPWRESLLLAVAEFDEALADQVLDGQEPPAETVWRVLRMATIAGKVHPCLAGSALRNVGVQPLMDAIVKLLPTPLERAPGIARRPDGGEEVVAMDDAGPLAALIFKVQLWEGRRNVFARIYRNTLHPGDRVGVLKGDGTLIKEHVARIFDVDAGRRTRIGQARAGQIVLLSGLRRATTGDTLCSPEHPLWLERIEAREPVLSLAIEPASSEDEEKMVEVLDKLREEDPTLRLDEDPETGQRLLKGMGELHLQILFERLEREFHLRVRAGRPAVALRETITAPATAATLFDREIELHNKPVLARARVQVAVTPLARGAGNQVVVEPRILPDGATLSPEQGTALEEGVRQMLGSGPLEGAPLRDLEIRVTEVELFGQASSPEVLQMTTGKALRQALRQARGVLLRPVMSTEVVVPEEDLGAVLGDLQARQAIIRATQRQPGVATISCEVGLDKLLGYTTDLRSMTHGSGQFSMEFDRFDAV